MDERSPSGDDSGGEPPERISWLEESARAEAHGLDLRATYAIAGGANPESVGALLHEVSILETKEYLRSQSGLSDERRSQLWQRRVELAGMPPDRTPVGPLSPAVRDYWRWLFDWDAPDQRPNGIWLKADLARIVGVDPAGVAGALTAWATYGAPLETRFPPAALATLEGLLNEAATATAEQPTPHSVLIACELARLSGFPPELIELYQRSLEAELDVFKATWDYVARVALRTNDVDQFRRGKWSERAATSATTHRPRDRQTRDSRQKRPHPKLVTDASGRSRLHLEPDGPEEAQLDGAIRSLALREAVDTLRLGHAPRPNLLYKKAWSIAYDFDNLRRDERGDRVRRHVQADEDTVSVSNIAPILESETLAIGDVAPWLCRAIDSASTRMEHLLADYGVDAVFPVGLYSKSLSRKLDIDHLISARNCLVATIRGAVIEGAVPTLRVGEPVEEFGEHLARTAPARWLPRNNNRQLKVDPLPAAAYVAVACLDECGVDAAPDDVRVIMAALWRRVREFSQVTLIAGTANFLIRHQLNPDNLKKAAAYQAMSPAWHEVTAAGLALIQSTFAGFPRPGESDVDALRRLEASDRGDLRKKVSEIEERIQAICATGQNNELIENHERIRAIIDTLQKAGTS